MSNESRDRIHTHLLGIIRARIGAVMKLPDDTQLSLACALNLLFLLRGESGSIGDYLTTLKAIRETVGDDLDDASTERDKLRSALEEIKFTASEAL